MSTTTAVNLGSTSENFSIQKILRTEECVQAANSEYQTFLRLKDIIEYPILVFLCLLGIIGSAFTLGTLCFNKAFSEPCYICYQAIAIFEMNIALGFGFNAIYKLFSSMVRSYTWQWTEEIAIRLFLDPFRESVSALTICLSAGRVVACFWPNKYHIINKREIYYAEVVVIILLFAAVDFPHMILTSVA